MKRLALLLIVIMPYIIYSQEIMWEKTFETAPNNAFDAHYVIEGMEGGYFILCQESAGKRIIKTDNDGNQEWELKFGSMDDPIFDGFLHQPSTEVILYIGLKCNSVLFVDIGYFYLLKARVTGLYLWHYFGWEDGGSISGSPWQMKLKNEIGYLVAGNYKYKGENCCYLRKTDEFGRKVWEQHYTEDSIYNTMQGGPPIETPEGNYLFMYSLNIPGDNYIRRYGFIKTDTAGNLIWRKRLPTAFDKLCYPYIISCPDSGIASVFTKIIGNEDSLLFNLVKTDKEGNTVWEKDYWKSDYNVPGALCNTKDGGFFIGGYTNKESLSDFYLIKTDSKGNVEWDTVYGSEYNDNIKYAMQCSDGHYMVCGSSNRKAYVAKIRDNNVAVEDKKDNSELYLSEPYPQPVSSSCMFYYSLPYEGRAKIQIYDALGNIATVPVNTLLSAGTHTLMLDISKFNNGLYFCRLIFKGNIKTVKMLVVK